MAKDTNVKSVFQFVGLLILLTVVLPFLLLLSVRSFSFLHFIEYLRELSLPLWILCFSILWLCYRRTIDKYAHLIERDDAVETNSVIRGALAELNDQMRPLIKKRIDAERSTVNLEKALAISGVVLGLLGIIAYLIKFIAC